MIEVQSNTLAYTFPPHDIPNADKDATWCWQYCLAMYREATTRQYAKMFFAARDDYRKYKEYGLSKQSVMPYRKWLTGADPNDKTWININWNIPPIWTKYRNIVVNKLMDRKFNINCTPIDPAAVDETAKWFADLKAKMKLRDVASKIDPGMLNTPSLRKRPEDPEDMEEFNIKTELGFKTRLAMDAELGIAVVLEQGNIKQERRMVIEDLVDLGVGIYKDWVENDKVCFRRVNPTNFITNYCRNNNFDDMTWGGELIWMKLSEICDYFTAAELKDMAQNVAGKNGNPRNVPYNFASADYDRFKVLVLDAEWLSYTTDTYKRDYTSSGNYIFKKKDRTSPRDESSTVEVGGQAKPKVISDSSETLYKCCWVVDTKYVYNYGLATDQKRKRSSYKETFMSYHAYAPDFYEMMAIGLTERVISLIDNYCETWFKVQNFLNKWIPYIIEINYDALENVNIGKGGKKMEPMALLDMLTQTNMIVVRKKNAISGLPEQNNAITVQSTAMASEIQVLIQHMDTIKQMIRDVTGLNEAVDGTGPAPRTNVPAQEQAVQGSNNAIQHFQYADSALLESLSDACLMRLQRVIKRSKVSGYVHSLGSNYVKFVQVSPDISLHEYAIKLEDQPDDAAKMALLQQLSMQQSQGLIEPQDYFAITSMTNLKEMEMKLIYVVKKRKQEQQQNALMQQQQTGSIQQQSAAATSQFKQQELQLEYQLKMQLADHVGAWQYLSAGEKIGMQLQQQHVDVAANIIQSALDHQSKMQQIAAQGQQDQQAQQGQAAPASPQQGQPAQ